MSENLLAKILMQELHDNGIYVTEVSYTRSRAIFEVKGGTIEHLHRSSEIQVWVNGENDPLDWLVDSCINAVNLARPGSLESIISSAKDLQKLTEMLPPSELKTLNPAKYASILEEACAFRRAIQKITFD